MVFGMGFLNLLLAHFDAKMIEKAGYGRMKWGAAFCAFLLPPAYLYMRASKSKQKPLQLYAWLAAVLCLGIGLGIGMAMLESRGGAGLKGKRARQEAGAPVILPGLPEKGNFADSDVRKPKEEPKEEPREEPKAERNAPSGGEEVNEDIFSGMRVARIKGDNVNVRREPSTQSKVMFIVHKEEDLLIIDKTPVKDSSGQNWYSVRYRWIEPEFDEVNFSAYIIEQFIEIGPITEELKAWLGNI
jgi:hypothetical protein